MALSATPLTPTHAALLVFSTLAIIALVRPTRRSPKDTGTSDDTIALSAHSSDVVPGVLALIGNTPLVRVNSLSDALGVEILGKAEFLNPGGSVKDRVALQIITEAERRGEIRPGSRVFEGTSGSTGISIAMVAKAKGYDATIVMPDDTAVEKMRSVEAFGATVERVRPASIVDRRQYVNRAKHLAREYGPLGYFADQFENHANFHAHITGTAPEIWKQTKGEIDAFISGAGTGGTIAGVGRYLKDRLPDVRVVLADCQGSGLYNKVKHGVMYSDRESEGTRRRHQVDTVVEGIGLNRLTANVELGLPAIDDAFRVSDAEAVAMARHVASHDGLLLGSSSAVNLVACCKLVNKTQWRGTKRTIVTILCDSGSRHFSKFWNDDYLQKIDIPVNSGLVESLLRP
ncbi:PALP-domain-containing protein [Auricularia subglabra TFB-10046 SS5]|uniref:cysteine synthase n=1 Tax=Auricularia subglabra (strain TFB-10046 / SS5) TaxID=717982 RepID=J0LI86_AURST|nr:PALP-domain-containing protein [Auricularia subglabra TFB-10046 SS5]